MVEDPYPDASMSGNPSAQIVPDCRVALLLTMLEEGFWPSMAQRTPRQARHDFRILAAATGTWRPVRRVGDALIDGPQGAIPARIYRPTSGTVGQSLVVYFHGGGFVIGDLFTADGTCRRIATQTGATVVSVHYRRAPEYPLPAAHIDAYAAARWAVEHAAALGADPARLVLAGDSAGGGLAAHVAQRLRDEGPIGAALQVLINPGLDFTFEHTDDNPALARLLDWDTIHWFAEHALPEGLDRTDPVISPARTADLKGLPPAVIITAGIDPFRADAEHYAGDLERAGVPVELHRFDRQTHGFTDMDLILPAARRSMARIVAAVEGLTPVQVPDHLPVESGIAWIAPHRGSLRRMRENAQRLPFVNGTDALWKLVQFHLLPSRACAAEATSGASEGVKS
ncbi:alpha/beta hydrolase [Pseudonocardia hispaniensis]|uniref:Alpha/beta hydrolase n=1 Tax=Pseudonocardia hispaniensis TaxID=904933 RepID=A0ABW1IWM6_9PSEU